MLSSSPMAETFLKTRGSVLPVQAQRRVNRLFWRMERPLFAEDGHDSLWWPAGLLVLSAVLLALSFPYPGWGWLAHVALAPGAAAVIMSRRTVWVLVFSYLVSVGWWLWALPWLIPVTATGYVLLAFYQALWVPAGVAALRVLRRAWGMPLLIAVPLVLVTLEWIRGVFPAGGFAWFNLAQTQVSMTVGASPSRLLQTADLFGEWTVSFLVAASSGMLAQLCFVPLVGADEKQRRWPGRAAGAALVGWFALISAGWVYGEVRLEELRGVSAHARTLRVGVVQTNVPQSNKQSPDFQQIQRDWDRLVALMRKVPYAGIGRDRDGRQEAQELDLIIWPETASPLPFNETVVRVIDATGTPDERRILSDFARLRYDLGTTLLVGTASTEWSSDEPGARLDRRYNSVLLFSPPDSPNRLPLADARYDKIHLVPFGEYMPWVDRSAWLKHLFLTYISPYDFDYSVQRGTEKTVFEVPLRESGRTVRVVTPICFEDAVSRLTRRMVFDRGVRRADFMVNLTNDGWFAGSAQRSQHAQIAALRAVELRTPMVRSVNTGISSVWDASGRLRDVVGAGGRRTHVDGVMVAWIESGVTVPLYARVGTMPVVVVSLLTIGASLVGGWRMRRGEGEPA